jgi:ubiquinone/menaquinone biosynthesis C-methylase UbiE
VAFHDATRGLPEGVGGAIVASVGAVATTRFLEVGVGTCRIMLPLVRAGCLSHGVDLSAAMLEALRKRLAGDSGAAGRLHLARADAMALPFLINIAMVEAAPTPGPDHQ